MPEKRGSAERRSQAGRREPPLTPEVIENLRRLLRVHYQQDVVDQLCELALDGLLFRAWINGAQSCPSAIVSELAPCRTAQEHRAAITRLIASGKIKP